MEMPEWSYMKNYKRSKKQNHNLCGVHLLVIIIYMDCLGLEKLHSISNEVTVRNTFNKQSSRCWGKCSTHNIHAYRKLPSSLHNYIQETSSSSVIFNPPNIQFLMLWLLGFLRKCNLMDPSRSRNAEKIIPCNRFHTRDLLEVGGAATERTEKVSKQVAIAGTF